MSEIFSTMATYFSYKFVVTAFIVGGLISLCASLLGVSLVLRRCSMIGDGLSHVAFGALALSAVLGMAPLAFSIPVVIIAAVLLLRVGENDKIGGEASIAMISSASLAFGVIAISLSGGMNTDVNSYMFGSLTAMNDGDVVISVVLAAAVIIFYMLFYNRIFSLTFDESFSRACGLNTELYKTVIAVITAVTIAIGMRVIGAMLISALVIFPALSAMRLFGSFRGVVICAALISIFCSFFGICLSCLFSLPTGAAIVGANVVAFLVFSVAGRIKACIKK